MARLMNYAAGSMSDLFLEEAGKYIPDGFCFSITSY
jgi:hypothetical protein